MTTARYGVRRGRVCKHGKAWYYRFDIEPDPLTGRCRQANGSGYRTALKVWTVAQLQTFLQHARSDRFFALWVLEATSGMRRELAGARRDLLDLGAGTLAIEVTRVVVDGRVIESDGNV
jgi:hypothetical protein